MVQSPTSPIARYPATELAECGWRFEEFAQPDGSTSYQQVLLTAAEFLHPQEGYHLPNSTFHDDTAGDAKDILTRRYASNPDIGVFRDLLIEWDTPLGEHCPDTFVAFGIRNKHENRSKFIVADEGVLPIFILEVVSSRYRKADRETKVVEYARARVLEYVIIDRRTIRQQILDEVLGYRLVEEVYQPITPDDDGRILCDTLGLWISLLEGRLVLEDAQTGQRLKTSMELEADFQELEAGFQELEAQNQELEAGFQELEAQNQELEAGFQELEAQNQELEAQRNTAQQQAAEMALLLACYREQFGDLPQGTSGGK